MTLNGTFYTTNFDLTNHYEEGYLLFEKFDSEKIWTAVLFDEEQQFYYIKRFRFEPTAKVLSFIGEGAKLIHLSCDKRPRFEIIFAGKNENRPSEVIVSEEFIGDKSFRAKGKRLTNYVVGEVKMLDPVVLPEDEEVELESDAETIDGVDEVQNEAQMTLFDVGEIEEGE